MLLKFPTVIPCRAQYTRTDLREVKSITIWPLFTGYLRGITIQITAAFKLISLIPLQRPENRCNCLHTLQSKSGMWKLTASILCLFKQLFTEYLTSKNLPNYYSANVFILNEQQKKRKTNMKYITTCIPCRAKEANGSQSLIIY